MSLSLATPRKNSWEEALILPGFSSLLESMVHELAEYLVEDVAVVAKRCAIGAQLVAEEWKSAGLKRGSDVESVKDFYAANNSYLYDLTTFNAEYPYTTQLAYLARTADEIRLQAYLDFGSGIGSTGIFFARNGFDVTLCDISPQLMSYALWRFKRRGLNVKLIDLARDKLPEGKFDLVTSLDVFEHLPDPQGALRSIAASMKLHGLFAFNTSQKDVLYPQHISNYNDVAWSAHAAGFRQRDVFREVHILERVGNAIALQPIHAGLGYLWFKLVRPPLVRTIEVLGIKEVLKRIVRRKEH